MLMEWCTVRGSTGESVRDSRERADESRDRDLTLFSPPRVQNVWFASFANTPTLNLIRSLANLIALSAFFQSPSIDLSPAALNAVGVLLLQMALFQLHFIRRLYESLNVANFSVNSKQHGLVTLMGTCGQTCEEATSVRVWLLKHSFALCSCCSLPILHPLYLDSRSRFSSLRLFFFFPRARFLNSSDASPRCNRIHVGVERTT